MTLRRLLLCSLISAGCATSPGARPGPTEAALHRLMECQRCAVRQALPDPEDAAMNSSALATVSTWRYSPASLDGQPVRVKLVIPVRFIVP